MPTAAKKGAATKRTATRPAAKKATPSKATAKKTVAKKTPVAPKAPKVERDMTAYNKAVEEYKALRKDVSENFASISYQARRATPDEAYAKTPDEAMAKLTAAVAAFRETARLFSEVAPKK